MRKLFLARFIEQRLKNIFFRAFTLEAKEETSGLLALLDPSRPRADFRALALVINDCL